MAFYGRPIRSPETKGEVKQAATILIALGVVFALIALVGIGLMLAGDKQSVIIAVVFGGVSLLLFAAGAYNIHYTRRMSHAPFMAAALRNPMITALVITIILAAVIFGGVFLLIFLRQP